MGPTLFVGDEVNDGARGTFGGPNPFGGAFDIELVNNEEFFFRDFETTVFTIQGGPNNGQLADPLTAGLLIDTMGVMDGDPGIAIPGNIGGVDFLGNPVPLGEANLNVAINNNAIDLLILAEDFSVPAGEFTLGLEGSNATTGVFVPQTPIPLDVVEGFIEADELELEVRGF